MKKHLINLSDAVAALASLAPETGVELDAPRILSLEESARLANENAASLQLKIEVVATRFALVLAALDHDVIVNPSDAERLNAGPWRIEASELPGDRTVFHLVIEAEQKSAPLRAVVGEQEMEKSDGEEPS